MLFIKLVREIIFIHTHYCYKLHKPGSYFQEDMLKEYMQVLCHVLINQSTTFSFNGGLKEVCLVSSGMLALHIKCDL